MNRIAKLVSALLLVGCASPNMQPSEPITLPGCNVEYTGAPKEDAGVPTADTSPRHPGPVGEALPSGDGFREPTPTPQTEPAPAEETPAPNEPAKQVAPVCDMDLQLGEPELGVYMGQLATIRYDKRALRFGGANTANDVAMATWVVLDTWRKSSFYDAAREPAVREWLSNPHSVVVDTNILYAAYPQAGRSLVEGLTTDRLIPCTGATGHANMVADFMSLAADVVIHELIHGLERKLFDDFGGNHARDGIWRGETSLLRTAQAQFVTLRGKREVKLYPDLVRSITKTGDLANQFLFESDINGLLEDSAALGGDVTINLNVQYALNIKRYARAMSLNLYEDAVVQLATNRRVAMTVLWMRADLLDEDSLLRMKCSFNDFIKSVSAPADLATLEDAVGVCPSPLPARACPAGAQDFSRDCLSSTAAL